MTFNRVLALTSIALGAMLVIQVALVNSLNSQPPQRRFHASWVNHANTLKEGLVQSDQVILGEVIQLRPVLWKRLPWLQEIRISCRRWFLICRPRGRFPRR